MKKGRGSTRMSSEEDEEDDNDETARKTRMKTKLGETGYHYRLMCKEGRRKGKK